MSEEKKTLARESFAERYLPDVSIHEIYMRLADEESREIFWWRYAYFKSRDHEKLLNDLMGSGRDGVNRHILLRLKEKAEQPLLLHPFAQIREKGVILYGAGAMLRYYLNLMVWLGIEVLAVCDTYTHGADYGTYRILTPEEALSSHMGAAVFITPVEKSIQDQMRQSMLKKHVSEHNIYATTVFSSYGGSYVESLQYFVSGIIDPVDDEVYIDVGSYDGDTILEFAKRWNTSGYKRIYGFEPQPMVYRKLKDTIAHNGIGDVVISCAGVWDAIGKRAFNETGDTTGGIAPDGSAMIKTVTLDEAVDPEDKVTLIKMDVQGAELNALYGAKRMIKRDKPRLAISVYHKPEDIVDILSYVLSLNPEYKLYLRHHSTVTEKETVLYAV